MKDKEEAKVLLKLGIRLRDAREKLGLTQEQVATKAQVSTNFYAVVERGESNVSYVILNKIVKALKKVDLSDLL